MWLTGWNYRKQITINGSSGAGTNYQVLLKVGESSGASGYDFHINNHSANFPSNRNQSGDLRFTSSDGSTLLYFWVEQVTGTSPNRVAYCWVKVSADLGTNQNIYCYYGNPSASNVSDGSNTFIFFNDGSTLNFDFYRGLGGENASSAFSVDTSTYGFNTIKHQEYNSNNYEQAIKQTTVSNSGVAMRAKVNFGSLENIEAVGVVLGYNGNDNFYLAQIERYTGYTNGFRRAIVLRNNGATLLAIDNPSLSANTWYNIELRWNGSSLYFWQDGSVVLSTTNSTFSSGYLGIHGDYTGGVTHWYYDIFCRKFKTTEPTFNSAGSEEMPYDPSIARRRILLR